MTFLTQFEDGSNMKLQCFGPIGMSMKKEPGWCSTAYRKRYKRMNVSFNVRKDGEEAVRYITVIYPVKKSADAPKFDAKFKNKAFDENGLEVEVKVNGIGKTTFLNSITQSAFRTNGNVLIDSIPNSAFESKYQDLFHPFIPPFCRQLNTKKVTA